MFKAPTKYTWSKGSCIRFLEDLKKFHIQQRIHCFLKAEPLVNNNDIDLPMFVVDFEHILLSTADLSLKKPNSNSKTKTK